MYVQYTRDVQYIGGVQYIQRTSLVHHGDIMSTLGGYHEYTGGYSVHWRDIMSISGGYREYIRDIMSTSGFSIEIERILSTCSP